ncbi:MAG: permease [Verrucomicrobiales bacterium]|nr:permease [Verrucomicrobiales bacterium]
MNSFRYAIRQLLKNPGFTLVAVLTLALGIGANTAIFSVVDQLLVRHLPVTEPERLALIGEEYKKGQVGYDFNYPLFKDFQKGNAVFSQLTATADQAVGLGTGGATERVQALLVSGNYFSMLGINAALGRTFAPNEGMEIDDGSVVVLGHGLWRRMFGADPAIVGKDVRINGHIFTVAGVVPREFTGTTPGKVADLYIPITMFGQLNPDRPGGAHPLSTRYFTWMSMMGRLKEGVNLQQAEFAMNRLAVQIHEQTPANTSTNLVVLNGSQGFTSGLHDAKLPLQLLQITAGVVLLIACANLANLQLARAAGRSRDFAIRLALGAGRRRLVRELLTESLLLSFLGGGLGLLVAIWLTGILQHYRPGNAHLSIADGLHGRALIFTLGTAVFTGLLFGLAPALRTSRPQILPELKSGGNTTGQHVGKWNLRSGLVVIQIALSLLVLVSAGLCTRSLAKLQQIDPGFEPSRVLLVSFDLGLSNYGKPQAKQFYDRLLERVGGLPGVESASLSGTTPLNGWTPAMSVERVEGYHAAEHEHAWGEFNHLAGNYFKTLSIPVLKGRSFDSTDSENSLPVVIINDAFAARYFARNDPIGKHVYLHAAAGGKAMEVVGVVKSIRNRNLTESPRPAMYFSSNQGPELGMTLSVKTGIGTSATLSMIRDVVKSMDATVPLFAVQTLEELKDGSLSLQRMAASLLGGFGLLALLLSALGIYGVLAYSVSQRTREIGVRMALGAQVADVLMLVIKQGLGLSALGLTLGLVGAFGATRLLKSFLYNVQPLDPTTFSIVVGLLGAVALIACWLPTRRATMVNPVVALRAE